MITVHLILIILAFCCAVAAMLNVSSVVNLIAAALAFFFLSLLLTGCTNGQAWTPEQATAYANAAHTVIHGAVADAKDAGAAYDEISNR